MKWSCKTSSHKNSCRLHQSGTIWYPCFLPGDYSSYQSDSYICILMSGPWIVQFPSLLFLPLILWLYNLTWHIYYWLGHQHRAVWSSVLSVYWLPLSSTHHLAPPTSAPPHLYLTGSLTILPPSSSASLNSSILICMAEEVKGSLYLLSNQMSKHPQSFSVVKINSQQAL